MQKALPFLLLLGGLLGCDDDHDRPELLLCDQSAFPDINLHNCACRWTAADPPTVMDCGDVSDLTGIDAISSLASVHTKWGSITDLTPVAQLPNLRSLWVTSNQLTDLAPLSNANTLRVLGVGQNQIADLTALTGLTGLEGLDLHNNQVTDVSPLAALAELRSLDVSGNESWEPDEWGNLPTLSGLGELATLPALSELWAEQTRVYCDELEQLEEALPELMIHKDLGCVPRATGSLTVTDFTVVHTPTGYYDVSFTMSWDGVLGADRYELAMATSVEGVHSGSDLYYNNLVATPANDTYQHAGEMSLPEGTQPDFAAEFTFVVAAVNSPCDDEGCWDTYGDNALANAMATVEEEL